MSSNLPWGSTMLWLIFVIKKLNELKIRRNLYTRLILYVFFEFPEIPFLSKQQFNLIYTKRRRFFRNFIRLHPHEDLHLARSLPLISGPRLQRFVVTKPTYEQASKTNTSGLHPQLKKTVTYFYLFFTSQS